MTFPRIVIAGTHSGVGKTTVATGIMAALHRRGLRVQGFKVGPDFIDPTFHEAATGRPGLNLDGWMLSRETNLEIFGRAAGSADVAVIEGAMGLFDGKSSPSLAATTAEMAMWLDAAVVLVLDASAMAGSAAAIVHGFDTLVPELALSAVVCNKAASAKHYAYLHDAIAARCRPAPLGYLPRDAKFRAAGTPPGPSSRAGSAHRRTDFASLRNGSKRIWIWIDFWNLASGLEASDGDGRRFPSAGVRQHEPVSGIARDAAFCFYYHDNLELLRRLGAELIEFSPIADRRPAAGSGRDLSGRRLSRVARRCVIRERTDARRNGCLRRQAILPYTPSAAASCI